MTVTCPVCDAEAPASAGVRWYTSAWNGVEYRLYRCAICAVDFWWPPETASSYYTEERLPEYRRFHEGLRGSQDCKWTRPFFERFPLRGVRLLDVGCGDGLFLRRVQELGFEVYGIDFDRKSVAVARDTHGLMNVFSMSLAEFSSYATSRNLCFQAVTFFEVLEHQDKPREFLSQVRRLLAPEGWIAGSVPNRDRYQAEFFRGMGPDDFPPHHLTWWSAGALVNCLTRAQFTGVWCCPCDFYAWTDVATYWEIRLAGRLTSRVKAWLKWRLTRDQSLVQLNYASLSALGYRSRSLRTMQVLRNLALLPLALLTLHRFNRQGSRLYFQAQGETRA